ncbi:flagellin [Chromobacterium vaccinii]|uniref:Flagellin n=1 Tax=Chromobacterium vaccinii TaxID=1108595 RepID=A0A1D9LGK4_9NEIS|nr:flagellin [Chromobacterium vaccinii]AOZ50324.1 flagellin [Chromobacterium vaccinii]QND83390.1 Flagellin protein FlaA [Chromobacterium vaccinii]QND88621.1 Flagellin protein FlaA [Chromobacterium vaccinii]SUX54714.1 Flagellin [Chromobacterium vaccinii]
MAITVNTNVSSLQAQLNLNNSQMSLTKSLQRLSSGLRVNSAKDDAAGLAISQTLTSAIRGNNQAISNANDGISVGQTAEGALGQIANNLQRIREIAVQSSNASVSNTNRSQLQNEVDQLTQEISRIVQTTQFNGTQLLSGSAVLTFQVGSSGASSNQVSISSQDMTSAGVLCSYSSALTATGTINITTQSGASAILSSLDSDIAEISTVRSTWGSVQNRFDAVVANLQNYVQNLTAANSRIVDVDFASETANLTKNQILQQAGASILKQANTLPQAALTLLQ